MTDLTDAELAESCRASATELEEEFRNWTCGTTVRDAVPVLRLAADRLSRSAPPGPVLTEEAVEKLRFAIRDQLLGCQLVSGDVYDRGDEIAFGFEGQDGPEEVILNVANLLTAAFPGQGEESGGERLIGAVNEALAFARGEITLPAAYEPDRPSIREETLREAAEAVREAHNDFADDGPGGACWMRDASVNAILALIDTPTDRGRDDGAGERSPTLDELAADEGAMLSWHANISVMMQVEGVPRDRADERASSFMRAAFGVSGDGYLDPAGQGEGE